MTDQELSELLKQSLLAKGDWLDVARTARSALATIPATMGNSATQFRMNLRGANIFTPDKRPDLTGIALDVQIWNTGTPSIAVGWALKITTNGKIINTQQTKIPEVLTLAGYPTILGDEALDQKTLTHEITRSPFTGPVLFYAAISNAEVLNPNNSFELTVEDIEQNKFTATKLMSEWMQG